MPRARGSIRIPEPGVRARFWVVTKAPSAKRRTCDTVHETRVERPGTPNCDCRTRKGGRWASAERRELKGRTCRDGAEVLYDDRRHRSGASVVICVLGGISSVHDPGSTG